MAENNKPDATGQTGNPFVSPSDTCADVLGKVADVLTFLSVASAGRTDMSEMSLSGATLSPQRGMSMILEACAEALLIAEWKDTQ